jgi:hypothetical protein
MHENVASEHRLLLSSQMSLNDERKELRLGTT